MVIKNAKIILHDREIDNGYIEALNGVITAIQSGEYNGKDVDVIDANGQILMAGFIDIHIHGAIGIDFMDAKASQYKDIAAALHQEGVTTFMATTLTSDFESLKKVCEEAKEAKKTVPSLGGIHFEGPYINAKHKGAQNENFIRNPDIEELKKLQEISGGNVRYIAMAPEKEGALEFIKYCSTHGVTVAAGHTDATFDDVEKAIKAGLTNTTHTHNAMSGHHHRNPGVVTAAMYFNELYTEMICDMIHVCPNSVKTFYKIVGPDRFIIITDALKAKHSALEEFELFGLPCEKKNGAAYLKTGPLAGSLLSMNVGLRNLNSIMDISLVDLSKISSYNAAKALHLDKIGELKVGYKMDAVLLDKDFNVKATFKEGIKVY
ncbi:MAG: N-acetylglucosamine-6-phosphate deacetylase [Bacilli bacterium]|nr:N-acetylglucosamine-6-phosphate deacetylase [Bacilli bacterium]